MSDELKKLLCSILVHAELIAKNTTNKVDDFVVSMLQKILGC